MLLPKTLKRLRSDAFDGNMILQWKDIMFSAVAILPVLLLPYVHIGVIHKLIWVPDKPEIDREKCTCSCFDTIFKGSYQKQGGVGYKHVYFNSTWQTYRIWMVTILFWLLVYESMKHLVTLIRHRHIRWSLLTLYVANAYPHYYSWWVTFGYYNDDFYSYFNHQCFFMVTEMFTTLLVLDSCNKRKDIVNWKMLAIISIASVHVLLSGIDQFLTNVFLGKGAMHRRSRDIALMIPDLFHIAVPLWELFVLRGGRKIRDGRVVTMQQVLICLLFVIVATLFGKWM